MVYSTSVPDVEAIANRYAEQAPFENAQSALVFAFNFSGQQYDRPLMNRLADKRLGGDGKGLVRQDGAAQAGMIKRKLKQLSNLHRAVLMLRFLPASFPCSCGSACCSRRRRNLDWEAAANAVGAYATEEVAGGENRYRLRTELVRRFYGSGDKLAVIAEDTGLSLRTVEREAGLINAWLRGTRGSKTKEGVPGIDALAMAEAEQLLSEAGVFNVDA